MSSAEHERLLRRARAQDVALFRYRLIGPALEEGLTTKQRQGGPRHRRAGARRAGRPGRADLAQDHRPVDQGLARGRVRGAAARRPQVQPVTPESVLAMAAALKREN